MKFTNILFLLISCSSLFAQDPEGLDENPVNKASRLYREEQYERVVDLLSSLPTLSIDGQFLKEISSLKVDNNAPWLLEELVSSNPQHPLSSSASLTIGKYYFNQLAFEEADTALMDVQYQNLTDNEQADFYYINGYLSLEEQNYLEAKSYFDKAKKSGYRDGLDIDYYQGFTSYQIGRKDEAVIYLSKTKNSEEYGASSNYFLAKMMLEDGHNDTVLDIAKTQINDEVDDTNAAFHQLIGEAYANQNETSKAASYFDRAIELHPSEPGAALYYQAGVAAFKIKSKQKAIEYFTKAGVRSGDYAKLSAFQLARLYISDGELEQALTAYKEASSADDREIKEESVFYAGKLNIGLENYPEGINYLTDYTNQFSSGKWKSEVETLLTEAYLRTSNYDQAISYLQELGLRNDSQKTFYQKVTFLKAELLFNDGAFQESIYWFDESLKFTYNQKLREQAYFYKGETYFQLEDYEKAIVSYQKANKNELACLHGLSYSYYNVGDYASSAQYFDKVKNMNMRIDVKREVLMRLGDSHFAIKNYDRSLTAYQEAQKLKRDGYVSFQLGSVYRLRGGANDKAMNAYDRVLLSEENSLYDDAIFNKALIQFEIASFEKAEVLFTQLINDYNESELQSEALLNRAISRTNLGNLDAARDDYELVLEKYIASSNAFDAILGLQELEQKGVIVKSLPKLIEKYKMANPDDASLEVVEYETAKSYYFKLDYKNAAESFEEFIKSYPNSSSIDEATYYMGDAFYRDQQLPEAENVFEKLRYTRNNLTGRVLSRLGDINFQLADYDEAVQAYTQLKSADLTSKDTYNARLGLLNSYYEMERWEDVVSMANEIITADWKPINAKRGATLKKAKAFIEQDLIDLANAELKKISGSTDVISAEANYLQALIMFNNRAYDQSLEMLFELNSRFGTYTKLVDQSYLLIADSYLRKGEAFQAKATLRSIVQHTTDEEVRGIAAKKLLIIEESTPSLADSITVNDQK